MLPTSRIVAGLVLSAAALSACSPARPGAAATFGSQRITIDTVRGLADELEEQAPQVPRAQAISASLRNALQFEIYEELARRQQPAVSVTDGEVDAVRASLVQRAGGEDQLQQAFLQQNVPTSGQRRFLESLLIRDKIGQQLVPGAADDAAIGDQRIQAVGLQAQKLTSSLHVRVNPRFGSFNETSFALTPLPSGGLATAATPTPSPAVPAG